MCWNGIIEKVNQNVRLCERRKKSVKVISRATTSNFFSLDAILHRKFLNDDEASMQFFLVRWHFFVVTLINLIFQFVFIEIFYD